MTTTTVSAPAERPDRLTFHFVWEPILLLAVIVLLVIALANGQRFSVWFLSAAFTGIVAFAFSLSVRAAVPNLAVAGAAALAATITAQLGGVVGVLVSLVVMVVVGALLAVFAVLLPAPPWAGTLIGGLALSAIAFVVLGNQGVVPLRTGPGVGQLVAGVLFGLAALLSIGTGVACMFWPVRRFLGRYRLVSGDRGRDLPTLGVAAGAIVLSTVAAGVGGIAGAYYLNAASQPNTFNLLYVLAPVLIGGASLRGRRAGVAGTFLGVLLVNGIAIALAFAGLSSAISYAVVAVVAVVGLIVSALADTLGGPRTLAE